MAKRNASVSFTIPGEPVAKGRPRMTKRGHVYTPARTTQYEKAVGYAYKSAQGAKYDGPVGVAIRSYLRPPKTLTKARRTLIAQGEEYPIKVPDVDNLAKCVLDGLSGLAYDSDKQVVALHIYKRWAQPEQDGYTQVTIKSLD